MIARSTAIEDPRCSLPTRVGEQPSSRTNVADIGTDQSFNKAVLRHVLEGSDEIVGSAPFQRRAHRLTSAGGWGWPSLVGCPASRPVAKRGRAYSSSSVAMKIG